MMDMYKLQANIDEEIRKIAEKGFSTSNIDNAMKLVDMAKDIKNMEYWEVKKEYYDSVLEDMNSCSGLDGGSNGRNSGNYSSRRNRRDSSGRYSRNDGRERDRWDEYIEAKHSFQTNKTDDCRSRMLIALEEKMDELTRELSDMANDSDCREERDVIRKYINKLQGAL